MYTIFNSYNTLHIEAWDVPFDIGQYLLPAEHRSLLPASWMVWSCRSKFYWMIVPLLPNYPFTFDGILCSSSIAKSVVTYTGSIVLYMATIVALLPPSSGFRVALLF